MKFKIALLLSMILLISIACSRIEEKKEDPQDSYDRYYESLKVLNDLTFTGVNELKEDQLEGKEYYHFFYEKGTLTKIKSYSTISKSFYELNKYIFNVNKEWKEININDSPRLKEYSFSNSRELIKFVITYDESLKPASFQVIPFNIDYDNFNILGRSVVYSGKITLNSQKFIDTITWLDSNAEYKFSYDSKKNLAVKNVYNKGSLLYEYRFKLNKYGTAESVK